MKGYEQFRAARRALLAESPRRCETGEVYHHGECMACGAYSGEACLAQPHTTATDESKP